METMGERAKREVRNDKDTKILMATHYQKRDSKVTIFFREIIPPTIRGEIEQVENDMWEEVNSLHMDEIREEVAEWVQDPGSTAGHLSIYDQIILIYLVMK